MTDGVQSLLEEHKNVKDKYQEKYTNIKETF